MAAVGMASGLWARLGTQSSVADQSCRRSFSIDASGTDIMARRLTVAIVQIVDADFRVGMGVAARGAHRVSPDISVSGVGKPRALIDQRGSCRVNS